MTIKLTDEERRLVRHALGLAAQKVAYRNRFSGKNAIFESFVERGLAYVYRVHYRDPQGNITAERSVTYAVLRPLAEAALEHGECIDREELQIMQELESQIKEAGGNHDGTAEAQGV